MCAAILTTASRAGIYDETMVCCRLSRERMTAQIILTLLSSLPASVAMNSKSISTLGMSESTTNTL